MGTVYVDQLDPQSGTTLTLGTTGDTVSIPSGVTLSNAGTFNASGITAGTVATARLGSGTASSSTYLRGDQSWQAISSFSTAPAFQASVGSGGQSVADNTYVKVQFSVEQYDEGSKYDNSSNYRFTPASSGRYFLFAGLTLISDTQGTFGPTVAAIYKNGAMITESKIDTRTAANASTGYIHFHELCNIVEDDGDDYFEIYVKTNNESGNNNSVRGHASEILSWFGGYKIA
jgi:hypothetical protein